MGCGCFSCGECVKFLSGSPGKSGSGSVDDFPETTLMEETTAETKQLPFRQLIDADVSVS